jgi:K+-sensing histidine kinase KdpD
MKTKEQKSLNKTDLDISDFELQLQEFSSLKNNFVRNINHEVHTPMLGISSMGQTLHQCYDLLNEEQKKMVLSNVAISSKRLGNLVDNVTVSSYVSDARFELNKTRVNVSELLTSSIEKFEQNLNKDNVTFKINTNIIPDIHCSCNANLIEIVIINLLTNAVEYGVNKDINISLKQNENVAKFIISDYGLGIAQDELNYIFKIFTVGSRTKTLAGGRGIGLYLCKKILEIHKEKIWAEHNNGDGSKFIFTLQVD